MEYWRKFRNYKQRGEWVELLFMAQAALHGFIISKPWGDCSAYDVGIELGQLFLRVQVKSTSVRYRAGYLCHFHRSENSRKPYTLDMVDVFAAYVIPEGTWYLIPASVILKPKPKVGVMLHPIDAQKQQSYKYEHYREAWGLLGKSREELATMAKRKSKSCVL